MSQILGHLKSITQPSHDRLETVSFAHEIMSQKITRPQYLQLLAKTEILYQAIEPVVNQFIKESKINKISPFISNRLADVKKDLKLLNGKQSAYILQDSPVRIHALPALIGTLYVLEGARLGGKVIVRALQKNTELADIKDFHFYEQAGIDTRQRWLNFRNLAEEMITDSAAVEVAARAAQETFDFFYKIHRKPLSFMEE